MTDTDPHVRQRPGIHGVAVSTLLGATLAFAGCEKRDTGPPLPPNSVAPHYVRDLPQGFSVVVAWTQLSEFKSRPRAILVSDTRRKIIPRGGWEAAVISRSEYDAIVQVVKRSGLRVVPGLYEFPESEDLMLLELDDSDGASFHVKMGDIRQCVRILRELTGVLEPEGREALSYMILKFAAVRIRGREFGESGDGALIEGLRPGVRVDWRVRCVGRSMREYVSNV